ncbi:hypothetical protein M409DRAFT_49649 [Zasmidium cellare ATCC 36951]|uniref:Uncharacterized protein n=1 Tax=Zasmidium cellare ATCC 36951 TaxID=1080233 RepID=A0A6A6D143_ZASCE|nr:uncharacterized protein M409DRAFT_49649 [Zasmidium cellare ATCC 36951]KAF2173167.1 hypothetical protein M409DRAFT_49649 [Zasmidium cellare ATCC 36951]
MSPETSNERPINQSGMACSFPAWGPAFAGVRGALSALRTRSAVEGHIGRFPHSSRRDAGAARRCRRRRRRPRPRPRERCRRWHCLFPAGPNVGMASRDSSGRCQLQLPGRICGRVAGNASRHWAEGSKCPRYNQPGAKNAVYYWIEPDERAVEQEAREVVNAIALPGNISARGLLVGDVFAGRLVVEDAYEQKFFVELRRFQEAVREHLEGEGRVPQWVEDHSLIDIEAVFELSLLRKARFSSLKPTSARAAKQSDLLGRVQSRISRFFATRNDLLRDILQSLLPAGFYRLPRADEAILQHELDGPQDVEEEGELEEERDGKDGEEGDLVPLTFPPIFISAATPNMLYDYTITIPLTQLFQTYKAHSDKTQDQELLLPGRRIEGTVKISFSGDVDEPWIERACIEEMESAVQENGNRTREFWEGLNEQTGLLAELVQVMIS